MADDPLGPWPGSSSTVPPSEPLPSPEPSAAAEPAAPAAGPTQPRVGSIGLAVVGVLVGVLLGAAVIVVTGSNGDDGEVADLPPGVVLTTAPTPSPAAADALVAALRRSRLATFALTEDFVRVAPSGVEVVATRTVRVQRPPDSLVRTDTAVDLVVAGRHTACTSTPDSAGRLQCRTEPAAPVDVEAAVAEQASILTGPAPLYTVADAGGGCFALLLRVERPAPPYGRRATLCYDPTTGAPSRSEITKAAPTGEVVDRTTASQIRGQVTDADLALPPNAVIG